MSGNANTDAPVTPTTDAIDAHYEKDVLVTGYARDSYTSIREFVADAFGPYADEIDLFEEETETREEVSIELSLSGRDPERDREYDVSETFSVFGAREKRIIRNAIENGDIDPDAVDWVSVDARQVETTTHVHAPVDALSELLERVGDQVDVPDELGYEAPRYSAYDASWSKEVPLTGPDAEEDETERFDVRLNASGTDIKRRRVLVHQSNRTAEHRYETPEDVPHEELPFSVQLSIHIEAQTREEMDALSEALVQGVYDRLATLAGISKVRLSDCEVTQMSKGECHQI